MAGVAESMVYVPRPSMPAGKKPSSRAFNMTGRDLSLKLSEKEVSEIASMRAEKEDGSGKTFARTLVEKHLLHRAWYNPDGEDGVKRLKAAWSYYEHVTLARYFVKSNTGEEFIRAEPGEMEETELYSWWKTPASELKQWGIGVGLYFRSIIVTSLMLLVAGLISIPNVIYFRSGDYGGVDGHQDGLSLTLLGSAVCTETEWVACEENWCDQTSLQEKNLAYAVNAEHMETGNTVTLVQRSSCNGATLMTGMVNYGAVFFLIISISLWGWYLRRLIVSEDEDIISSTDYSVRVTNPPPDAIDPDEWRDFFNKFTESKGVTAVTVALNNCALLNALVRRRILNYNLFAILFPDLEIEELTEMMENESHDDYIEARRKHFEELDAKDSSFIASVFAVTLKPILQLFGFFLTVSQLEGKIERIEEEIKDLQKKDYKATDIFVTFETEAGQRTALEALKAGRLDIFFQRTESVASDALFRGKVLNVSEPAEPSSIRWMDLGTSAPIKILQRITTFGLTIVLIIGAIYLIKVSRRSLGALWSGALTSTMNSVVPTFVKLLLRLENHSSEGGLQTSLYIKITLFRWMNTAFTARILNPFTGTLGTTPRDIIVAINGVLISELWLVPSLRLLDLVGNFKKHYLAPRAKSQRDTNLLFKGTPYNLADRYTDFTKITFVCFIYSALNPNALFMGFAALVIQYNVDKFCLMRIWRSAPFIGTQLGEFSHLFFTFAIVVCVVVCSYDWARFRYDNICLSPDNSGNFAGNYDFNGSQLSVESDRSVRVCNGDLVCCNQNLFDFSQFPAVPRAQPSELKWMSSEQEILTSIYGWTSVAVISCYGLFTFGKGIYVFLISLFKGTYQPVGQDQLIDFCSATEVYGYIPQVSLPNFSFPLLACDIDDIDQNLIGWNDVNKSYDFHNLIFDVPYEGMKKRKKIRQNTRASETIHEYQDFHQSAVELELQSENKNNVLEHDSIQATKPIFSIVKYWEGGAE